jgi:hypothetical protein
MVAEAMVPSPPALDTADAICHPVIHAMPPCKIGYRIFKSSVILVFRFTTLLTLYVCSMIDDFGKSRHVMVVAIGPRMRHEEPVAAC